MMYNNKLVCAIKVGGKVLREDGETVYIPFGSEYSFYIKNLHSRRAMVSISIDDVDIADGDTFVVNANGFIDIERFVRKNDIGNRFKFIERTAGVEAHRGIGAADGLIRVEYQFEKERPVITWRAGTEGRDPNKAYPSNDHFGGVFDQDLTRGGGLKGGGTGDARYMFDQPVTTSGMQTQSVTKGSYRKGTLRSSNASVAPANDVGVTVEGSISDQKFRTVSDFAVEAEKHVMVLKLLGQTEDNTPVTEAITTKHKIYCPSKSCRAPARATDKCCSKCGENIFPTAITAKSRVRCKKCDEPHHLSAKFCSNCGNDLHPAPPSCKSCGNKGSFNQKFCTDCGTSLIVV